MRRSPSRLRPATFSSGGASKSACANPQAARRPAACRPRRRPRRTDQRRIARRSGLLSAGMPKVGQDPADLAGRDRLAVEIALNLDTAFKVETAHLLFGLDAFGGRRHPEAYAEAGDRTNNGKAAFIDQQAAHE